MTWPTTLCRSLAQNCRRLDNHTALVTGSAMGIGRAIATRLAAEGATVVVADVEEQSGKEAAKEIKEKTGSEAVFLKADMSNEADIVNLLANARKAVGPLNIVVNNAARFHFGPLEKAPLDAWSRLFNTNVIGYALCIREALPHFRHHGRGAVINMASVSSWIAQPEMFIYNASKGAVSQLTRCLALDFAKENIRINAVAPGTIVTPAVHRHIAALNMKLEEGLKLFATDSIFNRNGQPEEVAGAVAYLASSDSSYVTGEMVVVDGGRTLPG